MIKNKKNKISFLFTAMIIVLIIEIFACTSFGAAGIPFRDALFAILKLFKLIGIENSNGIRDSYLIIITQIRLPRILLSVLVGASLSVAGAAFQGLFKNPLADPYIIGASSGGALGAAIAIVLKSKLGIPGFSIVSFFAFLGALISTYIVYMLGKVGGKLSITAIILSGIAVNALFSAALSLIMLFNREQMQHVFMWMMGSLSSSGWQQVAAAFPGTIAGIFIVYVYSKDLNLMLLGEEQAQHLGVNTQRLKKILLFTGAFITGIAVSTSGIIGFIGVFIPHVVRLILGPDNRLVVVFSAVFGGMFLGAADTLARTLLPPVEIPVGILTSAVGGPFFIYLLLKNKRKMN